MHSRRSGDDLAEDSVNVVGYVSSANRTEDFAVFVNRCFLINVGFVAMQFSDIICNENAARVVPGSATDSVFRIAFLNRLGQLR